jgi:hypothetical protein
MRVGCELVAIRRSLPAGQWGQVLGLRVLSLRVK